MRAVFIGASSSSVMTARMLLKRGHEVVIIEQSKETIDALSRELDCGYLHGDGSKPAILREAGAENTDFLYCLTDNDQANILASLVGRSLGFKRVVTKISDPELVHVCIELGLENTIIPSRTIGRYLAQMFEGRDPVEISAMIKDEARVFSFVVREEDAGPVGKLDLPSESRVICMYRREKFMLPDDDTGLEDGDEVVLITHSKNMEALAKRWGAQAREHD